MGHQAKFRDTAVFYELKMSAKERKTLQKSDEVKLWLHKIKEKRAKCRRKMDSKNLINLLIKI